MLGMNKKRLSRGKRALEINTEIQEDKETNKERNFSESGEVRFSWSLSFEIIELKMLYKPSNRNRNPII